MGMQIEAVGPVIRYGRTVARFAQAPFTGGTGRFAEATGSALERLFFPAASGPWLTSMVIDSIGTITYDASDGIQ